MAKYSKFNIVYQLQKWMDSVAGQTFMNYAYSWGAAVVILGTLFKLTHLPGANVMLFIGMGTEVFVFFISAFDRPFDKTAEGRNLATDSELAAAALAAQQGVVVNGANAVQIDEEGIPQSENEGNENIGVAASSGPIIIGGGGVIGNTAGIVGNTGGGVIINNGGNMGMTGNVGNTGNAVDVDNISAEEEIITETIQEEDGGTIIIGGDLLPESNDPVTVTSASPEVTSSGFSAPQMGSAAVPSASPEGIATHQAGYPPYIGAPAPAVSPETAKAMEESTTTYIDRLNELNELLLKVAEQSERLTTDSQEMENLNRTLTGIARVYEMQLKSASQQITTQDEINEQTRKMAQQIQELNSIYARMIDAMSNKVSV